MTPLGFTAGPAAYGWLTLAAIGLSVVCWMRFARQDNRLMLILIGALAGAFIGAKLLFLMAEGWIEPPGAERLARWWTGKSIIGGLLGGYAGVEIAKKICGYTAPTGDRFALIAPIAVLIGRIGCLVHGCCLGRPEPPAWYTLADAAGNPRWPAVPVEMAFNVLIFFLFLGLRARGQLSGQHFHIYLIGYGCFRLWHEALRDTPKWVGSLNGYQIGALGLVGLGAWRYWMRAKQTKPMDHDERPGFPDAGEKRAGKHAFSP